MNKAAKGYLKNKIRAETKTTFFKTLKIWYDLKNQDFKLNFTNAAPYLS